MVVTLDDWEPLAKERLPQMALNIWSGGAGDEITLRGKIAKASTGSGCARGCSWTFPRSIPRRRLFGQKLKIAGLARSGRVPEDDSSGRRTGIRPRRKCRRHSFCRKHVCDYLRWRTSLASRPIAPWFQLYGSHRPCVHKGLWSIGRGSPGCTVLCFTVDAPVRGQRDRDTRDGFRLPPGIERPNFRRLESTSARGKSASRRPVDLQPESRSQADVGIPRLASFRREDARTLEGHSHSVKTPSVQSMPALDGMVVSNHGGRVIDTVILE